MITVIRDLVQRTLSAAITEPVYQWLPGTADDLPAVVVGRPDVVRSASQAFLADLTVPVYVLGRTIRDDDAQGELDALADQVMDVLWTVPEDGEAGMSMRLVDMSATTTEVAGVEIPSYVGTVAVRAPMPNDC